VWKTFKIYPQYHLDSSVWDVTSLYGCFVDMNERIPTMFNYERYTCCWQTFELSSFIIHPFDKLFLCIMTKTLKASYFQYDLVSWMDNTDTRTCLYELQRNVAFLLSETHVLLLLVKLLALNRVYRLMCNDMIKTMHEVNTNQ